MRNVFLNKIKTRSIILIPISIIWIAALIFRLVQLQVLNHTHYKSDVLKQNQAISEIFPKRGTIFDRNGNILARSIPKLSVFYQNFNSEPYSHQMEKIQKLKELLQLTDQRLEEIRIKIEKKDSFIWIKRRIEPEIAKKVKDMELSGIYMEEESKRKYPHGSLAAHIIGRVRSDDIGASGIEYKYNSVLAGKKGERLYLKDAKRRQYRFEILKTPIPGKNVVLTIDETIQFIAEDELRNAVSSHQADWGTVILCHPDSGEILAMAHSPSFDLNSPPKQLELTDRIKAVHAIYAPGSTFKLITGTAAIESNKVDFTDTYDCSLGYIDLPGKKITDHKKFGILNFPEILIHSSNVGAVLVGNDIGKKDMYATIKSYGMGNPTGIDLPGEERGITHPIQKWNARSLASLSIGYEISVTPIQTLQVVNIIANQGVSVPPRIVKNILDPIEDDQLPKPIYTRIISRDTALSLAEIMEKVVLIGTGTEAFLDGYVTAGKTGTAQRLDNETNTYSSSKHISSFTGYVSTDRPIFSMIVVIDNPQGKYYGGEVAAPIFREISSRVLLYMGIPPIKYPHESIMTAHDKEQRIE